MIKLYYNAKENIEYDPADEYSFLKAKDCEVSWKYSFQEDSAITITKIEQEKTNE